MQVGTAFLLKLYPELWECAYSHFCFCKTIKMNNKELINFIEFQKEPRRINVTFLTVCWDYNGNINCISDFIFL